MSDVLQDLTPEQAKLFNAVVMAVMTNDKETFNILLAGMPSDQREQTTGLLVHFSDFLNDWRKDLEKP
jgi:hypothetical protein